MSSALATDDPVLTGFADEVGTTEPVSIEGGRTRWSLGGEPDDGVRFLRAPSGIVEYAPEEMTVCVRAGTPVAELQATLAERGQRSALPDRGGTVGGALAVGENDVRAMGRGMVRTCVLQVRYVSAEGIVITSGGPTVKNVTGFDLPRLMVGALGTLGLLAEVILRTNPIPPVSRWVSASDADPAAAFAAVVAPSAVLYDGTTTWIELEGHGADVDAEQAALARVGSFEVADGPPDLPEHRWSLPTSDLLAAGDRDLGRYVSAIGLGLMFAERPQPPRAVSPEIAEVGRRLKTNFDPTGRLNPGRDPAAK